MQKKKVWNKIQGREGHHCETVIAAEAENKSDRGWAKVSDTSLGSSPGSVEAPVRARCPRQAPGACSTQRHTQHTAPLLDGFAIFLTGHDISLGLAAEKTVRQPPAATLLGNTSPAPARERPPFPQESKSLRGRSDVKEPRAAGGKLWWRRDVRASADAHHAAEASRRSPQESQS